MKHMDILEKCVIIYAVLCGIVLLVIQRYAPQLNDLVNQWLPR